MSIDPQVLPLFAGSALILTLIPGVNVFMVLRSTINSGIRSGLTVVAGSLTASTAAALVWSLLVRGWRDPDDHVGSRLAMIML